MQQMRVHHLPEEDLEDVFKHCNLVTRGRMRRVCRYWKYLVSLPEVNEVVISDWRCILVSGSNIMAREHFDGSSSRTRDDSLRMQFGWYDVTAREATSIRLADHGRNGLLGPHVRVIVYDGFYGSVPDAEYRPLDMVRAIRSIGYFCTGVKHIILKRVYQKRFYFVTFRKKYFRKVSRSGLPLPETLTVVASQFLLAHVELAGREVPIKGTVTQWSDLGQSDEEFAKQFLACSSAQCAWVAKYAPLLPEQYHEAARNGVRMSLRYTGETRPKNVRSMVEKVPVNLCETNNYDQLHPCILRTLAFCILCENVSGIDAPPEPFDL